MKKGLHKVKDARGIPTGEVDESQQKGRDLENRIAESHEEKQTCRDRYLLMYLHMNVQGNT